jgi:hypothetical protein
MKTMMDDTWSRRGINFLWDEESFALLRKKPHTTVLSFRAAWQLSRDWPEDLPANDGRTLIVAGLDTCLDLMTPHDASAWITSTLRPLVQQFQTEYDGEGSLVFWIPNGAKRIYMNMASEQYNWHCAVPKGETLEIGRLLWSGAESDVARIINQKCTNQDVDGPAWIGLHHPRVS